MKGKGNIKKYIVNITQPRSTDDDDYVVKSIGACGIYQVVICLIAAGSRSIVMWNVTAINFLTPNTEFVCTQFENEAPEEVQNSTCYDNCIRYEYSSIFESTIVSEFDLICHKAWMKSFTQTVLMFGVTLGVSLFGLVSDRYGRRASLAISVALATVFSIAAPFAPNYWTLTGLRFIVGLGCGGGFTVSVVIIMEIVGPQYREIGGAVGISMDGFHQIVLVAFAYYSSTSQTLLLYVGLFSILILASLMLIPETPRWLIVNQQGEKAVEMLTRAAKFNRLNTTDIRENVMKSIKGIEESKKGPTTPKPTFLDLFRTKHLTVTTLQCIVLWMACGFCFFGINQYVSVLGTNIYLDVVIDGIIQILATLTAIFINKWCGRRLSTFAATLATGIVMGILIFLPDDYWLSIALSVLGMGFATMAFAIIYVQVTELFPTPLRNMGFGVSSSGAKFGAMIAPFIVNVRPHWIPSLVFTIVSFIGAAISLTLPETKGLRLKDTID